MKKSVLLVLAVALSSPISAQSFTAVEFEPMWVKEVSTRVTVAETEGYWKKNDKSQLCKSMTLYLYPVSIYCYSASVPVYALNESVELAVSIAAITTDTPFVVKKYPLLARFSFGKSNKFVSKTDGFYKLELTSDPDKYPPSGISSALTVITTSADKYTTDIVVY